MIFELVYGNVISGFQTVKLDSYVIPSFELPTIMMIMLCYVILCYHAIISSLYTA